MTDSPHLKTYKFQKVFIFNSSLRYKLICNLASIKEIYQYPLFKKRKQHIILAAQSFVKKSIGEIVKSEPIININEKSKIYAASKKTLLHKRRGLSFHRSQANKRQQSNISVWSDEGFLQYLSEDSVAV